MKHITKYNFKITVIGDGSVGKTSLIKKYTQGDFQEDYIKTIGAQFTKYQEFISQDEDEVNLLFWDIAGQDDFNFLRPSFYKDTRAAIIVYSLEENELGKRSFENISKWHDDIKQFCGTIPIVVFANKVDLVDENNIDKFRIEKLVNKRNFLGYSLTSAKTGEGVISAFERIIKILYEKSKTLFSEK